MTYYAIPTSSLSHIQLFGFKIIEEDEDFIVIQSARGEEYIAKEKPILWIEDVEDALQLGAVALITKLPNVC